jgi:hypothetical protein
MHLVENPGRLAAFQRAQIQAARINAASRTEMPISKPS